MLLVAGHSTIRNLLINYTKYLCPKFPYRNIEELTRDVNQLHVEIDNISLENEELRERLGISSSQELDVDGIRKKRAIKDEQAQALNRVLQKEVHSHIFNQI